MTAKHEPAASNIISVPIPTGATGLSDAVDIEGYQLSGLIVPSGWVTATAITLQASDAIDGTFVNVYDDGGSEVALTVAASRCVAISANALNIAPLRFVKFRSGTAASPVDQTNSPSLKLILKR